MTEALDKHKKQDGEGHLCLTLAKNFYIQIDGDIRIFLREVDTPNQVRLSIICPKEVSVVRLSEDGKLWSQRNPGEL